MLPSPGLRMAGQSTHGSPGVPNGMKQRGHSSLLRRSQAKRSVLFACRIRAPRSSRIWKRERHGAGPASGRRTIASGSPPTGRIWPNSGRGQGAAARWTSGGSADVRGARRCVPRGCGIRAPAPGATGSPPTGRVWPSSGRGQGATPRTASAPPGTWGGRGLSVDSVARTARPRPTGTPRAGTLRIRLRVSGLRGCAR